MGRVQKTVARTKTAGGIILGAALFLFGTALVHYGCEKSPTLPELTAEDIPFGTLEHWAPAGHGVWQLKKGSAPEDFPFGVMGLIHADCGKKCPNTAHDKVINHRSGESVAWVGCSGPFTSSAGDSTLYKCEERPQLVSADQFAGPNQTLQLTISFDDRGTNKPVDDLYRWDVTAK